MAYTVTDLITRAYYLTGVVSRDFETVSGPQLAEGLSSLNDILADKTSDQGMIPYFQKYTFNAVVGQEEYFIPNLIQVSTLVFYLSSVRYSMMPLDRDAYFGLSRAQNIKSLPFKYHTERMFGGANIYIYFLPEQPYEMELWGQFRMNEVSLNDDLSLSLDRFYIDYLKYNLAQRICNNYNYEVPTSIGQQLSEYEKQIGKSMAKLDLVTKKISTFNAQDQALNYAQVNIGRGWTIP